MTGSEDIHGLTDAGLVVAIARYREDALEELYARHGGPVFALANRLLRDRSLAEEITQEVFLRLWRDPERFDPGRGALRSYLLADTHGRSVDLVRSEDARRRREEREALAHPEVIDFAELEREVWSAAVSDSVREALATIPEDERTAIELAYFGGHTYREVARLLDQPEGTVKSRIRSGLRRLRAVLTDAGVSAAWT